MSSSIRNPRILAVTAVTFAVAVLSLVIGATAAFIQNPAPVCARVSADTFGIAESRDGSSILLRIPASKVGSPYLCGGDAQ